jgi:hypothetical protein
VIGVQPHPHRVAVFAKVLTIREGYDSRHYRYSSGLSNFLYASVKAS